VFSFAGVQSGMALTILFASKEYVSFSLLLQPLHFILETNTLVIFPVVSTQNFTYTIGKLVLLFWLLFLAAVSTTCPNEKPEEAESKNKINISRVVIY
jgi:hypothetical protein